MNVVAMATMTILVVMVRRYMLFMGLRNVRLLLIPILIDVFFLVASVSLFDDDVYSSRIQVRMIRDTKYDED